jgi:hypothetical protein
MDQYLNEILRMLKSLDREFLNEEYSKIITNADAVKVHRTLAKYGLFETFKIRSEEQTTKEITPSRASVSEKKQ